MFKLFGHFINKWDVVMWAGAVSAITSDLVDWVGSNATIVLGVAAFLVGFYKSWVQGRLLEAQRKTERLEQEKLKKEIERLQSEIDGKDGGGKLIF